jgi:hypothetical protein
MSIKARTLSTPVTAGVAGGSRGFVETRLAKPRVTQGCMRYFCYLPRSSPHAILMSRVVSVVVAGSGQYNVGKA